MWQQYAPRVMAYALRQVDRAEAEDVVAETFLVAWRRFAEVPPSPLPWLLVVARNTIANLQRSGRREAALQDRLQRAERLAEPAPAADAAVLHRADVLAALAALTDAEREALLLVAWDGLTPAEAARVVGCATATFHVRLFRARRRLRHGDRDAPHRGVAEGATSSVTSNSLADSVRSTP
ncbi:RNA polymerase sigma factor [Krasilnikovia sp. MM14-A1259]|uniref:RNA polymerase sigma factor n=1 Tax=Krasilnikovia sp. MM14-A1259 TaxID=3373539 RepID=UPI0038071287